MKNAYNFLLVIVVMVFVIGCNCRFGDWGKSEPSQPSQPSQPSSSPSSSSNKTLADKATDVVTTGEKTGVPECDELMDYFRSKIDDSEMDYISKAFWKTMEAQFREGIKQSLEQNNADRQATALFCKEFKKSLDEQEAKQQK